MIINDVISHLEAIAPPVYQESYDNAGLITGSSIAKIKGVLVCLDATEAILDEALELGCNLIVAHHPIVFRGLKKITGRTYVERVIIKAIKNDLAIFAAHTNLDNVFQHGVNSRIAERLGLINTQILVPKRVSKKVQIFAPTPLAELIQKGLHEVGAGNPVLISKSQMMDEGDRVKLEMTFPAAIEPAILHIIKSFEGQATIYYDIFAIEGKTPEIGSGMIGSLPEPMEAATFLHYLKERMQTNCVRHTAILDQPVEKVALCGGAGGFLLPQAIRQGAQVFVSADYKYHDFFDADQKIIIADIGHYESEQFTIQLLNEIISQKFSNFAVHATKVSTNPVYYL